MCAFGAAAVPARQAAASLSAAHMVKHENPHCRREVVAGVCLADFSDKGRHIDISAFRYFFQHVPEHVFQANAGLMPIENN